MSVPTGPLLTLGSSKDGHDDAGDEREHASGTASQSAGEVTILVADPATHTTSLLPSSSYLVHIPVIPVFPVPH